MNKTKIEWCDATWNPVIGCKNQCPYCYARRIEKRFNATNNFDVPKFSQHNFEKKMPKKASKIFVNSMSDIGFWEKEWFLKVIERIEQNPLHIFMFLTKTNYNYCSHTMPKNCWGGYTWTGENKKPEFSNHKNITFCSIEPILDRVDVDELHFFNWIIIGAETGNRKYKVIPKKEWIIEIVDYCYERKIPVFMKNSLKEILDGNLIREFPGSTNE